MGEWKKYSISEISDIYDKDRIPLSLKQRENRRGDFPYYGAQGIIDYIDEYIFDGEYLLIAEDGENLKSKKSPIAQIVNDKFWLNNHAHILKGNHLCRTKYLYYVINKIDISGYITGSAQPKLNQKNLKSIVLKVPTLKRQDKIIKVIDSLDKKIELNNRINDNLEKQSFAIFDKLFPYTLKKHRKIGDFITPKRGKNLLSKNAIHGDVPVVAGGLEPSTYHNKSNTYSPVLTISASGANAGFIRLWNIPVWSSDSSYIDSKMTKNVYFWYVLLKKRQNEVYDSQTGSAQPHIYPKHIAEMQMADINEYAMTRFVELVNPLFEKIQNNNAENLTLSKLRDVLLPKLMSGEIDVSFIEV